MSDDSLRDHAAAHALGALSAAEAAEVERELERQPELAGEVTAYREVAAQLAHSLPPLAPPAELRDRLLQRVRSDSAPSADIEALPAVPRSSRSIPLVWALPLAASVAVAVGAGWMAISAKRTLQDAEARLSSIRFTADSLAERLQYREATLDAILLPGTTLHEVGTTPDPGPVLQIFWVKERQQWLVHATRLPPAPSGKSYQLWYVVNNQAISANVFNTDPDGHAFFELELPLEAQGGAVAAITVEPVGGSPQPTTTPMMLGNVDNQGSRE